MARAVLLQLIELVLIVWILQIGVTQFERVALATLVLVHVLSEFRRLTTIMFASKEASRAMARFAKILAASKDADAEWANQESVRIHKDLQAAETDASIRNLALFLMLVVGLFYLLMALINVSLPRLPFPTIIG